MSVLSQEELRAAIAAAEDQHLAAVRDRGHRRVHQRLVVDLLIVLRRLRVAVEHEHLPEHGGAEHRDRLERRTPAVVRLFDGVRVQLGRGELLGVPLIMLGLGHRVPAVGRTRRIPCPPQKARCLSSGPWILPNEEDAS